MVHLMSCFVLQLTCFLFLAKRGHSVSPTVTKPETLGWGAIGVSPNAFVWLEYDDFQVSIYRKEGTDDSSSQKFYCSPALILQPNSTRTRYNYFLKTFETTFLAKMWYPEYRQAIQEALSSELRQNISQHSIRMLPIEEIRIDSKVRSDEYHIANEWTSYANQPSTFTFRITCSNNETCIEIAENIRQHPNAFTSSLEVFYSLQTQRTEKRSVLVKLEHMRSAELFAKLQLEFPDEDHVYLLMADWKKIQLEVSTTVLDTEMTDDDFFVSSDEAANIGRHLDRVLRVKHVGSGTFTPDMWSRVFWTAETARPDVTIKILNDIYDKNDRHLQEALKRALRTSNNSERSGAVLSSRPSTSSESAILFEDLQTIWNSLKASGSWGLVCPDKKNSHAGPMSVNEKRSRLKSLLMDARQVSTWNGEEFVVKPIQLTKISLAAFRGVTTSTTVIVNIQMKVARTTSELRTRINVPKKSAIEGVMPGQVEFVKQFSRFEPFARNEISKVSEMLREIKANLSGSEALVQHMFAVLSAADSSNGGQVANYSVTIQDVSRTPTKLSTNLSRSESNGEWKLAKFLDQLSQETGNLFRSEAVVLQKLTDLSNILSRSKSSWKEQMAHCRILCWV